ncbi:MAG: bacterioferritin [Bdellovibrionales bacterium]|nr:bacterioferritin [Bdellovibrionales bacterium]
MKGNPAVITELNKILTNELSAINQYFLHARMCKSWGYEKIADKIYHESIDEMKHAQAIIDRILFLEGIPNLQKLGSLNIGETIPEQLQSDLDMELKGVPDLKKAIDVCMKEQDHTSRELVEKILASEEEHIDWLEAQLQIIKEVGVENYLATQLS